MAIKTFSVGEVVTATDTNTYLANAGLVYVASGTLNLTTTMTNVTGVFSATYKNYRVVLNITARSTTNRFDMRYLVGTTPSLASYFASGIGTDYASNTTLYFQRSNNDAQFYFDSNVARSSYVLDIFLPNVNCPTYHTGQTMNNNAVPFHIGGGHYVTQQNTGFQLGTNTGTMTVEYQVFGYREG